MVWKCPPLNLFNWNNIWKWKEAMSDGGKGDTPRPLGVPLEQFDANFDAIFKKKPERCINYEKDLDCSGKCDYDGDCKSCTSDSCGKQRL